MNNKTAIKLWDCLVQDINGTPSPFAIAAIANGVIPVAYPIEFNWQEASAFLRKFADDIDNATQKKSYTPKPMEKYKSCAFRIPDAINVSAPPKFYSPLHTPTNWQIPKTQNEKHSWYQFLSHTNPKSSAFLNILTYKCSESFPDTKFNMTHILTFLYDFCQVNHIQYKNQYKDPWSWIEYNDLIERFAYEYFVHGILCIKNFKIIEYSDIKEHESNAFITKRTTDNLTSKFDDDNGLSILDINFEADQLATNELYLHHLNNQLNLKFKPYLDHYHEEGTHQQFNFNIEVSSFLARLNDAAKKFYNKNTINKIGIMKGYIIP